MYLNCHSYYSLRYGTLSIQQLVATAARCGVQALALTDINATTGVFDFIRACRAAKIKAIVGIEFRRDNQCLYIALAKNHTGFYEMNRHLSRYNITEKPLPCAAPEFSNVIVIYPLDKAPQFLRPFEYIGIRIEELLSLRRSPVRHLAHRYVVLHPITFSSPKEYTLHRLLRAVDYNTLYTKIQPEQCANPRESMLPLSELHHHYRHHPQILDQTKNIIESCHFEFDFAAPKNKQTYTGSRYSDKLLLTDLAMEGLERRYGKHHTAAKRRVQRELDIIDNMNFSAYFLITWDIIRYSLSRGFHHVGRGSGANSIVSYLLRITDVCPLELDLYFERFLNPSRSVPPDFDIDWSWKDRDAILNYTFKRFGSERTAFVGTIGLFKHRSIMRELGKTLGLPKEELDELSAKQIEDHPPDRLVKAIHTYGMMLSQFPNQRSLHSCGILIAEKPITYYTALDMPPKGFQTAQMDMYMCEDIGFEKLDILSQRGIGHINDAVQLIEKNKGVKVDIHKLEAIKNNPDCNTQLATGQTIGCFYIESPAMRGLLRRLKCNNYKTLVAASSVIRPGVAKSGMMREYIFRHNHPGSFQYQHPIFEEQLSETYGIMVYQEDVIKIAHYFAGLDLADADILRRAMSGKKRLQQKMEAIKERFFANCQRKGYCDELSEEVYRQIESFAGYSFCKAHSASYSVESYQSLYLKVNHPLEFMVAVMNNFGGFYRTEVYVHEARMAGGIICNPCVNRGAYLSSLDGQEIIIGFIHIRSLPKALAEQIVAERRRNGRYTSLENFVSRTRIGIEALQTLIFVSAFQFLRQTKNELILQARMLFGRSKLDQQAKLFSPPIKSFKLPPLQRHPFEDAFDEIELLGFMIKTSPFDLLQTSFRGDVFVKDLHRYHRRSVRMLGYLISVKDVPTANGHMHFGTWIDVQGHYFDTTHFPPCLKRYPFTGAGCYLIKGKVIVDFEFPSIEVEKMAKLPMIPDPRYSSDDHKVAAQLPTASDNHPGLLGRKPYPSNEEVKERFGR